MDSPLYSPKQGPVPVQFPYRPLVQEKTAASLEKLVVFFEDWNAV